MRPGDVYPSKKKPKPLSRKEYLARRNAMNERLRRELAADDEATQLAFDEARDATPQRRESAPPYWNRD